MTTAPDEGGPSLSDRLALVRASIADAVAAAGRTDAELALIAVTKFHSASLLRDLASLGVTDFGESRHQEAREKAAELAGLEPAPTWHFVGQVQGKKARQIASYAAVIHSLDRLSVAEALSTAPEVQDARLTDLFLQVNLTDDPARGGVAPGDAERLAVEVATLPGIRLRGVMAVAPLGEEPRPAFERLRVISLAVRRSVPTADAISAGMSNDFVEAILEGATHLRIGSAITGNRPPAA